MARRVTYTYSGPFNRLTSYTDPNGNTTNYGYDSKGNLLAITYANETQDQFSYDPLGNLTETSTPAARPSRTPTTAWESSPGKPLPTALTSRMPMMPMAT